MPLAHPCSRKIFYDAPLSYPLRTAVVKMRYITIIVAIICIAAVVVILASLILEKATLSVDGPTPVWDTATVARPQHAPIFTLQPGSVVPISECLDLKSYFMYKIILADGRTGYVEEGEYHLHVYSIFSPPLNRPLVFNCH